MSVTEVELKERAVAPRVTAEDVERQVMFEHYFTAGDGVQASGQSLPKRAESLSRLTFCVITMRNGYTVVGQSACASPENYQKDIGERIARKQATGKICDLLGFELCTKLAAGLL